jgi:hypothetical protein
MRKCAYHGTENNCAAFVPGGNCNGILHGTDDGTPAPVAPPPLAGAVDVIDSDESFDAACVRYAEDLARLVMAGLDEANARVMLDAPGSPWHGFAALRADIEGNRNARAAEEAAREETPTK